MVWRRLRWWVGKRDVSTRIVLEWGRLGDEGRGRWRYN